MTRVDNVGAGSVTIVSVDPLLGASGGNAIAVNRVLGAGKSVVFRSGPGAVSGTVLTTQELYRDNAGAAEGTTITVSTGRQFTDRCDVGTAPPLPSQMAITLSCNTNPERTTLENTGQRRIDVRSIETLVDVGPDEPYRFSLFDFVLWPGQSITLQSGSMAAGPNVLDTSFIYTNTAGSQEGVRIVIETGKTFTARC